MTNDAPVSTNNPALTAASVMLGVAGNASKLRKQLDALSTHVSPITLIPLKATVDGLISELNA
jgi:hypothetical protein